MTLQPTGTEPLYNAHLCDTISLLSFFRFLYEIMHQAGVLSLEFRAWLFPAGGYIDEFLISSRRHLAFCRLTMQEYYHTQVGGTFW